MKGPGTHGAAHPSSSSGPGQWIDTGKPITFALKSAVSLPKRLTLKKQKKKTYEIIKIISCAAAVVSDVCKAPLLVLGTELPSCSNVFEYLQDGLSLLVRQVFHGSLLPLLFHTSVVRLLSSLLLFIALLQVLRYLSIILQT